MASSAQGRSMWMQIVTRRRCWDAVANKRQRLIAARSAFVCFLWTCSTALIFICCQRSPSYLRPNTELGHTWGTKNAWAPPVSCFLPLWQLVSQSHLWSVVSPGCLSLAALAPLSLCPLIQTAQFLLHSASPAWWNKQNIEYDYLSPQITITTNIYQICKWGSLQ